MLCYLCITYDVGDLCRSHKEPCILLKHERILKKIKEIYLFSEEIQHCVSSECHVTKQVYTYVPR